MGTVLSPRGPGIDQGNVSLWCRKQAEEVGAGGMNVTVIRNIVYVSISITIGSSLCFGGVPLVSALPCCDRFEIPKQHSADRLRVWGGWGGRWFPMVILFSSSSIALWFSLGLGFLLFIALCLCDCWSIFLFLYHYVSIAVFSPLACSVSSRAGAVHPQNEKTVSRHKGADVLARSAPIVICGLVRSLMFASTEDGPQRPIHLLNTHARTHSQPYILNTRAPACLCPQIHTWMHNNHALSLPLLFPHHLLQPVDLSTWKTGLVMGSVATGRPFHPQSHHPHLQ